MNRELPVYRVRVIGGVGSEGQSLAEALLDVPAATDDDAARLDVTVEPSAEEPDAEVCLLSAGDPVPATSPGRTLFVVRKGEEPAAPTLRTFVVGPKLEGVDLVRAALLDEAFEKLGVTADRARRAKRPLATAIIAGAALMSAVEGVLPGAAAFVVGTQVTAIASLYYLYTGKWMARSQTLALVPVFASEAAGGSLFLLAKSFFPPTGIADAAAAAVAASMTVAMLGAVAALLEQGASLDDKEKLRAAFQRLRAKTKAERGRLVRDRKLLKDKNFFRSLVRRMVFVE
jgi:hypothetical protein